MNKVLILIFTFLLLSISGFGNRGYLPSGHEWRECKPGMVIGCPSSQCDSICFKALSEDKSSAGGAAPRNVASEPKSQVSEPVIKTPEPTPEPTSSAGQEELFESPIEEAPMEEY